MWSRAIGFCLLLAWTLPAHAEERFYPVPGPDGSVQLIRSEQSPEPADSQPAAGAQAGNAAEQAPVAPAAVVPPVNPEGVFTFAPYDSDSYVDVEAMEAATRPEGRKRFYLINDGMGDVLSESDGMSGSSAEPAPAPVSVAAPARYTSLPLQLRTVEAAERQALYPGLPGCIDKAVLAKAEELPVGEPTGLVLDRQTYTFLDKSRVVQAYRMQGDGSRRITSRSFASTDKRPAFVFPALAFAGRDGCLRRIVSGFFDRLYAATPNRHPVLQGDVEVQPDDGYVLVVAVAEAGASDPGPGPRHARHGQLKLTLKNQEP